MNNREKIKVACLSLFNEYGIHGTSTKMILEASGVSNGGLFHHFPTKEDIVIDIYYDIKEEMYLSLKNTVDINLPTRSFLQTYWFSTIKWGLDHPHKKLFLDMYSNSTILRNCSNDQQLVKFAFLTDRIQAAIDENEIVSPNLLFFIYHFSRSTDAIINYINASPVDNTLDLKFNLFNIGGLLLIFNWI